MHWCGSDTSGLPWPVTAAGRPDPCFCNTFLFPVPALLYLTAFCHRWHVSAQYLPYNTLDAKSYLFLLILQVSAVSLACLHVSFYLLNSPDSFAQLLCSSAYALGLAQCSIISSREAWRLTEWPGMHTKLFLLASSVVNLLTLLTKPAANGIAASLDLNFEDESINGAAVTHGGERRTPGGKA